LRTGVPVLENRPVVLPNERNRDQDSPTGTEHARNLTQSLYRVFDVVKRLVARDEVERRVVERQKLVGDDVGDAVRIVLDVEARTPSSGRQEILVRTGPAVDVEHVPDVAVRDPRDRSLEVAEQPAEVHVVELGRAGVATAPPRTCDLGRQSSWSARVGPWLTRARAQHARRTFERCRALVAPHIAPTLSQSATHRRSAPGATPAAEYVDSKRLTKRAGTRPFHCPGCRRICPAIRRREPGGGRWDRPRGAAARTHGRAHRA